MKRLLAASLIALGLVLGTPLVHAAETSLIFVTAPSHRESNGKFIDDLLSMELTPVGSIGGLLYTKPRANTHWAIDPALIEDVIDMSDGYTMIDGTKGVGQDFAKNFLARVRELAASGRVDAIVYGNPSQYWEEHLTPHEKNYLLVASQKRLEALLRVPVGAPTSYLNINYFSLPRQTVIDIRNDYNTIQNSAIYMDPVDLENIRLSLTKLFNPAMSSSVRALLLSDLNQSTSALSNNLRLAPGRFTVTSSTQNLPITIINDFPGVAKVNLMINSLNERVSAQDIKGLAIPGKSKVQVMVPVKVLTSGDSALSVVAANSKGDVVSQPQIYNLSLKVISPIATWITSAAAITLFLAALLQSLRRVRRKRSV
jgi:hypothetical protein